MILPFKIFQMPFADAIISSLHFSSQNKKTSVLVFFKILTQPTISSPTLDVPINFKSNEIVINTSKQSFEEIIDLENKKNKLINL